MSKVFISYSSHDEKFATWLAKELQSNGIKVWYAEWEVRPGDSITQAINSGIGSSDFLVVILTKKSVKSKWVQEEMAAAIYRTVQKGGFVLPALLEKCTIPPLLEHRRILNFERDPNGALQELLSRLSVDKHLPLLALPELRPHEIVQAYSVHLLSPLALAVTSDHRELPLAKCLPADFHPKPSNVTSFATRSCVLSCDLSSQPDDEWVRVNDVIVRIRNYSEPPPIVDVLEPLPMMEAHLCYVQIDEPFKSGKTLFTSSLFDHCPLGHLILEHGKPERLYIMIGALSPGVYDLDIGVTVSYKDITGRRWLSHQTVYFYKEDNLAHRRVFDDPITVLRSEADSWKQREAIEQIAVSQTPEAFALLSGLVVDRHRHVQVRQEAAEVLGRLGDSKAFGVLANTITQADDWMVHWGAARGLASLGTQEAIDFLISLLDKQIDRSSKHGIILALEELKPVSALPALCTIVLNDQDQSNRENAAMLLGKIGDKRAVSSLLKAIHDEHTSVKEAAAFALSQIGEMSACEEIREAMSGTPHLSDKQGFIKALGRLRDTMAVPYFIEMLIACERGEFGCDLIVDDLIYALSEVTGEHFGYLNHTEHRPNSREAEINRRIMRR